MTVTREVKISRWERLLFPHWLFGCMPELEITDRDNGSRQVKLACRCGSVVSKTEFPAIPGGYARAIERLPK